MIAEKHVPQARRLRLLYALCGTLLLLLATTLGYRQLLQKEEFKEREHQQAHRRILRPGPRGEVLDREGRLLIGNMAHFSAVINLETLREEIGLRKITLIRNARKLKQQLLSDAPMGIDQAIAKAFTFGFPEGGNITIRGKTTGTGRVKAYWQSKRISVKQLSSGQWSVNLSSRNQNLRPTIVIEGTNGDIQLNFLGLCESTFPKAGRGKIKLNKKDSVRIDGIRLEWEARYAVVKKYLSQINRLCGRQEKLSMGKLKSHYHRRLVLPMKLAGNLEPEEYATLIESIPVDSPIHIVTEAVRHYPYDSAAAHVLGYVGSGYEPNLNAIPGAGLATFELKGRSGKAGIEKFFDAHLRGKDGGDIWRVDPIGSKFELVLGKQPEKGKSLLLSLDIDLQIAAEQALENMIHRVTAHRSLPDPDWNEAVLSRTRSVMKTAGEKEEGAELLLQAFRDAAPFPLGVSEAYTVAGFEGTKQDVERLLQTLYTKGVLDRRQRTPDRFVPATPPFTPGAAVLLKVDTGEILAIASKPDYDLNGFSPHIPASVWQDVNRRGALLPRALNPGYPPASTYKLVTAIAALRNGAITPEFSGRCDGIYKGMECHVHQSGGQHGEMTLVDAIAQSCNIFFFRAGEKASPKALIEESKLFDMHEAPNIEMPPLPDRPIVPDPQWKMKRIGERWKLEDTFNVSIGQGGLVQSPLRMACFAASLARGKTRTLPTLRYHSPDHPPVDHNAKPIGISPVHYGAVIDGMAKSATEGTAKRCKVEGIKLAGKTGTGEWRNNNMKLSLAWFIGFAPLEKPEVAVAVLIEGVVPQDKIQGGRTAVPVAQKILQAYFDKKKGSLATHP